MEFGNRRLALAEPPKGVMASLQSHTVLAETEDEAKLLREIRAATAREGALDDDGNPTITYGPVVATGGQFSGRVLVPKKRKDGREQMEKWSLQAVDIIVNEKFGKSRSGYSRAGLGTFNDRPSIGLGSKDRERLIMIVSSMNVLLRVIHNLRNKLRAGSVVKRRIRPEFLLLGPRGAAADPEVLVLEVRSVKQAMACLEQYGEYLDSSDEGPIDQASAEPQKDNHEQDGSGQKHAG